MNCTYSKYLKSLACLFVVSAIWPSLSMSQTLIDFEDVGANLGNEDFYNGSDNAGGFSAASLLFNNSYNETYDSWTGWSYSNRTDTTTPGFVNQYSSIVGQGDSNSATYAVAFGNTAEIQSTTGASFQSFSYTNTTFAALSIRDGDAFAKQFGGPSGNDPDFFSVDVLSLDVDGNEIDSLNFLLADYRFEDNSQDFIVTDWRTLDVSSLNATRLGFRFNGSDVGQFGLNTPAYFALDNVVVSVPEPNTVFLLSALGAWTAGVRRRRCA